ncbi:MAG: dihydrodipicolinate synthase family protein [Alphaproteobacteria bacterium]|nr:MAG: dihydrodipicolinate synthase family protein [Alphaproteobacteria bacterium]
MEFAISGVWSAVATPLDGELNPDRERLDGQCRWLLDNGCDGIALLGTTGEANSFSVGERKAILEGVIAGGVTPDQLAPGVGVAAISETIELTRHALSLGVTRVVMLPPFYYKNVGDDGVFAAYARIIEGVADSRLKVVLYNIPQQSGVPLSLDLVAQLVAAYPDNVAGIKDSTGKLDNTLGYCGLGGGFAVMVGSDPLLSQVLQAGGAGCITAVSNLCAPDLRAVFDGWNDPARAADVAQAQARLEGWRAVSTAYGTQLPAIKAMLALRHRDAGWNRLRPPLMPLPAEQRQDLEMRLQGLGETV